MLAEYDAAGRAYDQALELYPADVVGDPALISLDRAAALIATNHTDARAANDIEAGAILVVETLYRLPTAHRTRLFLNAASDVVNTIPQRHRGLPAVREALDALTELTEHTQQPVTGTPRYS